VAGRPRLAREVERRFWRAVAAGLSTQDAAASAGVSGTKGRAWFTQAGGMSPVSLTPSSGRYLSMREREDIAVWRGHLSVREIARRLGRAPSTVCRELARNSPPRGPAEYRASTAQAHAEDRARRPKQTRLAEREPLAEYVQDHLGGPARWSPQQIARRLVADFSDDEDMRISHEAIYRALYVQGRGQLRRDLAACLRTGRAVRRPRRRADARRTRAQIPAELLISQRPAEVADRAVPGHWEGDLIIGKDSGSAIGTLVERSTRFVILLHLPGDHGALAVRRAIADTITTLPAQLRRSLTWDQGIELTQHAQLKIDTGLEIYFCDPHSPWQRGSNENTNGLLRQYFPKGTDLSVHDPEHLAQVAAGLNGRPRKTLHWRTPAEALNDLLSNPQPDNGVATTP
jgi:transposase, IS30 family